MSTDTVPITLTMAVRHALSDLVGSFLHDRGWEGARAARYSIDIEAAAAKLRRLAAIKALAEGDHGLPELAPDVYDARMELAMADAMTSYLVRNLPPEGSLTASDFADWAIRLEVDGRRRLSANRGA